MPPPALGSVVAISSEGGAPVATYAYDPWGAPLATRVLGGSALDAAVAARQPFRHGGYTLDAETGLYYLPVRYYDPATARFLSPDPAPPSAGDPASLNPYVYCQDDPIGTSDPSGAIMDADGDGKVSAVDCAEQMARLSSGTKMESHWRQRVNAAWKALKARQAALAAARARALAAAKAAAADRAARMAMAQARVGASLAAKAAAEEASKEGWADRLEGVQTAAAVLGLAAGVVLLCSPVGWVAAAATLVAFSASAVGLAAGAGRAGLGDDDYGWKSFAFVATVTFVTMGIGGGFAVEDVGVATFRASGAAWTACEGTMLGVNLAAD